MGAWPFLASAPAVELASSLKSPLINGFTIAIAEERQVHRASPPSAWEVAACLGAVA